jgi:hypothetical protein
MLSRLNRFWSKFQINFPCCCSVSNCPLFPVSMSVPFCGQLALVPIRGSGEPLHLLLLFAAPNPFAIPPTISTYSKSQSSHHLPAKQVRGSAHAPLRRDLASAQVKPAILGPEIGLEVRSILEHLLHPTQPLTIHHLPALPDNRPIPTTSLLNFYGFPANTRVRVCTHKSTVS